MIGQQITFKAGKQIQKNGTPARISRDTTVTVRKTEPARNGKTRVFWKSMGYLNSALV
jgi:hypothetical protein